MNANEVIEAYVTDVAVHLPRGQRNDVALELRELLTEELQGKAEAAGRPADAAMATDLANAFGRPADVAARYRPTLTIIDPADGYTFLRASIVGLAIIWWMGLLTHLRQPIHSVGEFLTAYGQWWGTAIPSSLWWPGLLVVYFGAAAWARREWPKTSEWKPRPAQRMQVNRVGLGLGIVGVACGLFALIDPRWVLDAFFAGKAAPAAYEAFIYSDAFRQHQEPWLLGLIALNIPLMITVMVKGRWSPILRRFDVGLSLATCAVLTWTALDGPVFIAQPTDQMFKLSLVIVVAFTLVGMGLKLMRSVRPAPDPQRQAAR